MNVEEKVVSSVFGYDVVRDICYRSITSSINELSKCVVTGSGVKLGGRVITKRDLDVLEFLNNFKLSTYEQLDRYMKIKNNERIVIARQNNISDEGLTNCYKYEEYCYADGTSGYRTFLWFAHYDTLIKYLKAHCWSVKEKEISGVIHGQGKECYRPLIEIELIPTPNCI